MSLKDDILSNPFIDDFRDRKLNADAFALLCEALQKLRIEWDGKSEIDKELAAELYFIRGVAKGIAIGMKDASNSLYLTAWDWASRLDQLILACFSLAP